MFSLSNYIIAWMNTNYSKSQHTPKYEMCLQREKPSMENLFRPYPNKIIPLMKIATIQYIKKNPPRSM